MAKTRGTGLLMAWTDVDPEHEDEFNAWYDTERQRARPIEELAAEPVDGTRATPDGRPWAEPS